MKKKMMLAGLIIVLLAAFASGYAYIHWRDERLRSNDAKCEFSKTVEEANNYCRLD